MINPLKKEKFGIDRQVAQRGLLPDNCPYCHLIAISTIAMVPINKIIKPNISSVRLIIGPD
jgi:hypothetical protein